MRPASKVPIGLSALVVVAATMVQHAAAAPTAAGSATTAATAATGEPSATASDKVRLLLDLVGDPDVRGYLEQQNRGPANAVQAGPHAMPPSMAGGLGSGLQRLRSRILDLADAVPRLPGQFTQARSMLNDMLGRGDALNLALFVPLFVALGFGSEWLFRANTRRFGRWLTALPLETGCERVSAVFARLGYGIGIIASFALGSIGAMLPFDWTTRFKQVLLSLLVASVIARLSAVVGRFLLAPGAPRFRVVPLGTPAARFLFRRLVAASLLLGIGLQIGTLMTAFGFDAISQDLCLYALGLVMLGLALETVWRFRPAGPVDATMVPGTERIVTSPAPHVEWRHLRANWARLGLSIVLVLLWCFAVADAVTAFWALLFLVGGPIAVAVTQRSVHHVLRPAQPTAGLEPNRLEVILTERGIRTLMIAGGALLLAHLTGVDAAYLTIQDTVSTRAARAVMGVVVVVLVADFLWHVIVALIDRRLAGTLGAGDPADPSGHQARLQTLLPILKNLSLAVLAVVAAMMVLAALGVEIGPLIASAGVVGVAIGFGAQTLVKDIISGIFYLVDDAFRVGEYIQSGTYKGTVESFSLRSVKLRHQRGALYTVPFGILGAVQNQSRDWVVDKITINVPYDTDLERVRKIIKRIGETLAEDEEFGPEILKPLKLQGVAQFGDYAIQLQTKMMTKPGDVQFAARRRALMLIKSEFQANGIGFALPMVQVSGDGSDGAAAQRALSVVKAAKVSAAE
jgi:small-conductance mechanosensitive channel